MRTISETDIIDRDDDYKLHYKKPFADIKGKSHFLKADLFEKHTFLETDWTSPSRQNYV